MKDNTASTNQPTQTTTIDGGINGLRQLIDGRRAKGSHSANHQANKKTKTGSKINDTIKSIVNNPNEILYCELTKNNNKFSTIVYIEREQKILSYKDNISEDEYNQLYIAVDKMASAQKFIHGIINKTLLYIIKSKSISTTNDEIVYRDKYALKGSSLEIFNFASSLLSFDKSSDNKGSADSNDIVEKLLELNKLTASKKPSSVSNTDAIKAFALLGRASIDILKQVFAVNDERAKEIINSLRLSHMLGDKADDNTYEIISTDLSDLKKGQSYRRNNKKESYCRAVAKTNIGEKTLTYDLDDVDLILAGEKFNDYLVIFCKKTTNHAVRRLIDSDSNNISSSEILKALSQNAIETDDFASFDLFNQLVTKPMLVSGWFKYFPSMLIYTSGIDALRTDINRYILANLNWLAVSYQANTFMDYALDYGKVDIKENSIEQNIRREYIRQAIWIARRGESDLFNSEIDSYIKSGAKKAGK